MKSKIYQKAGDVLLPVCLALSLLLPNLVYSQNKTQQLLTAHENADKALITGDSSLFYSSYSPGFKLIRSNGQELDRDQFWQMAKGMPSGMKIVSKIVSINVGKSVAWITYRYDFSRDTKYSEAVNYVEDLKSYKWIATAIYNRNKKNWILVQYHYSDAPEE